MRKRIAVVAGGDSGEYQVSVNSGHVVARHLDPDLFEVYLVMIKGNDWHYQSPDGHRYPVDREDFSILLDGKRITFECIFIAIHGTPGENGRLQGYFDLIGIPYTTCGQTTSALTFDKYFTVLTVRSLGVNTARSVLVRKDVPMIYNEVVSKVGLPCFVKPNAGGSSVATSRVNRAEDLEGAVTQAFGEDSRVLVESYIPGREITCGVIRYKGEVVALPITEVITKKEFFDYEAKYQGAALEVTPADIPESTAAACRDQSLMLYRELDCRGMVRFDYIFNESGLYFLEVNTVPGLSEASIVPQQAEHAGISLKELFTETIFAALEK